jgi:hypothetical protein
MNSPHLTPLCLTNVGKGRRGENKLGRYTVNSSEASPALHLAAFMDNVSRPHTADIDHVIFPRLVSGVSAVLSHIGNKASTLEGCIKTQYELRGRG